jgi:hypothetical protein
MDQCIVYQLPGEPVAVLYPCDCGLTIEQIGRKDVPVGVAFWIMPASTVPTDRTFRDAWELDTGSMGEPSGFGGAI